MLLGSLVLFGWVPRASAQGQPSLATLRAQRVVLLRRIANLTDASTASQARAAAAGKRRFFADLAADTARRQVARYVVDSYVDGVQGAEVDQLRRNVYADVASKTDRLLFTVLDQAKAKADAESEAADHAVDDARRTTDELRTLRAELEATIADREAADQASADARRLKSPGAKLSTHPRYARTTRAQSLLFQQFTFGPVSALPDGLVATGQVVAGPASWYGPGFDGRPTASGAIFDQEGWTVASKELPLGTILLIHRDDRMVLALVNDRGPYVAGRVLDLSHGVAEALGTVQAGVARVTAEVVAPTQ